MEYSCYNDSSYQGGIYDAVRCTSYRSNNRWIKNYCQVSPSAVISCISIDDYNARCTRNRAYGFEGDSVWVAKGCNASFEVLYTLDTTTIETTTSTTNTTSPTTSLFRPQSTHQTQSPTISTTTSVSSNSSISASGYDNAATNGAIIGGVVCGAVAAIALAVLMCIFIHRRTKSRLNNEDTKKTPSLYDYAYEDYRKSDCTLNNVEEGNSTRNQTTESNHRISANSLDNAVYGGSLPVDSHGYLVLDNCSDQPVHNNPKENEYEYAYSDNVKKHSPDDYVNARVQSSVIGNELKILDSRHLPETSDDQYQEYELAQQPDSLSSSNLLAKNAEFSAAASEYVLAKQPEQDVTKADIPSDTYYSLVTPLDVMKLKENVEATQEYSLAVNPEQQKVITQPAKKSNLVNKSDIANPNPMVNLNDIQKNDIQHNHIYQNTKVKDLIAKMNAFHSKDKEINANNAVEGKNSGNNDQSQKENSNGVSNIKTKDINSGFLNLNFPKLANSKSESNLNVTKKTGNKVALLPPKRKMVKSASTDVIYENNSEC